MSNPNFEATCKGCGHPIAGAYEWMHSDTYPGYCYNCEQSTTNTRELDVEYAYFLEGEVKV